MIKKTLYFGNPACLSLQTNRLFPAFAVAPQHL